MEVPTPDIGNLSRKLNPNGGGIHKASMANSVYRCSCSRSRVDEAVIMTHAADAGSFHLRGFVYMHLRLMVTLLRFGGGRENERF